MLAAEIDPERVPPARRSAVTVVLVGIVPLSTPSACRVPLKVLVLEMVLESSDPPVMFAVIEVEGVIVPLNTPEAVRSADGVE